MSKHWIWTFAAVTSVAVVTTGLAGGASAQATLVARTARTSSAAPTPAQPFDLNGDGKRDIVVGTPAAFSHDGAVVVTLSGRSKGQLLRKPATNGEENALFGLAITSDPGPTGVHMAFGAAVVAADFNGDGWPDLAVGSPGDTPAMSGGGSGAIVVVPGGSAGFAMTGAEIVPRPSAGTHRFGQLLAVGDLNRDGHLDLVQATGSTGPGAAGVVLGGPAGFRAGPTFTAEEVSSVAIGDVTGDGYDDVVFGEEYGPDAWLGTKKGVPPGQVVLYRGSRAGLVASSHRVLRQSSPGVPGSNEPKDRFGSSIALTDLDRDGKLDVVIGAPGEDNRRGRVTVVHGANNGFARRGSFTFTQATRGVPGHRFYGNRFGVSVAALDVVGSGRRDLLVGAPGTGYVGSGGHVGSVTVLAVSGKRWHATGTRRLTTTRLGLAPATVYRFGAVIASGRGSCVISTGLPAD